jgi:hypothetical protein
MYTPTVWTSGTTPLSAPIANNFETQYQESTLSIEQDLLTPFILFGFTGTMDGTTHSQLDVTAGVALIQQTDGTLRRRSAGALNYSCTGHPSTTLFLDVNPDGTFSFATTHSGVTNHLTLLSVTTDSSSNILTVTDARTLNTTFLINNSGGVLIPLTHIYSDGGNITSDGAGSLALGGSVQGNWMGVNGGIGKYFQAQIPSTTGDINNVLDMVDNTAGAIHWEIGKQSHANGDYWRVVDVSNGVAGLTVAPNAAGLLGGVNYGLPMTRNGGSTSAALMSGSSFPTTAPPGSIFVKA